MPEHKPYGTEQTHNQADPQYSAQLHWMPSLLVRAETCMLDQTAANWLSCNTYQFAPILEKAPDSTALFL
jgi:hypothetical protein